MYFELTDLFVLCVFFIGAYYWFNAQKVREFALQAARNECKRLDLQLLDGSVSLRSIKLQRNDHGLIKLARSYKFEFSSTGAERYSGKLSMIGLKVTDIYLQPHRLVN